MKLLLLPVCFRHYVIYIALPFVWQWQLFCIWLRLWTSETLSAPEPKSDARLTQNLFFGSPHASHLIYPPSGFGSGGHPGSHNTCPDPSFGMFLICSTQGPSHSDHRQCSHAHTLPRSYNQAADMRSQIWPQHDVMAREGLFIFNHVSGVFWCLKNITGSSNVVLR